MVFDNSGGRPELIAEKTLDTELNILDDVKFNKLKQYYHENS